MDIFTLALLVSVASCGYMTGLVVFVQLVHYPTFLFVDKSKGAAFHNFHTQFTGFAVGLPMVAELIAAFIMIIYAPDTLYLALSILSAVLLLIVWLETGLRVIPVHNKLQQNALKDDELINKLIKSNRIRTYSWTARFLLLLLIIKLLIYLG